MDRNIPHVLDVFTSSPGAKRRLRASIANKEKDYLQKNPGSDSAVSVGSSDEENEEQRNITMYFDYLNEDDLSGGGGSSQRRKKKKKQTTLGGKEHDTAASTATDGKGKLDEKNEKNKLNAAPAAGGGEKQKERPSRKGEYEKDIRHIERHLSMKKTIRKKIMRDLQQAFVEDPKDLQQDPKGLTKEKKNNIDINNLTFSKNRLSKSEHNFLDMLKDDPIKERKGLRALIDFRKDKPGQSSADTNDKTEVLGTAADGNTLTTNDNKTNAETKARSTQEASAAATAAAAKAAAAEKIRDDDSGHGSPTRDTSTSHTRRSKSKDDLLDMTDPKDSGKKQSFWKRITGKGKAKR